LFPTVEIYCVQVEGQDLQDDVIPWWENDVEFVPSCPTSRHPSPTREDADLEGVLMGYPNISPAPFTNLVAFKRICLARSKRLVEGTQTLGIYMCESRECHQA